jgi:molecular chaperone GrpE
MNSDEIKNEEITDTGKEVKEEVPNPEAVETEAAGQSPEDALQLEKDKYVRLYSEFDNFRRRTARERLELLQTAGKDVIGAMLPVLDDLERALKSSSSLQESHPQILEGFQLIHKKMNQTLEGMGLKPMDSKGQVFDAEIHEAVTKIQAPDESLKGKVVDELEKGYYLNDKVIRFAKVVVGE